MVNLVAAQKPMMNWLMKMAGVEPHAVEIEPGTVMNFWVPVETIKKQKPRKGEKTINTQTSLHLHKPTKPVVVLVHGFAAEGIVTWQFQVGALTKKYSVYIPDLLFFGGSITNKTDRSPTFQAETLVKGLKKLGVDKCTVVGFSYGGMVAFKMAELNPELVQAMVVSGSILAMTDSISNATLSSLGFKSSSELLLPTSVKGLKALLSVATYKKLWFPNRLHKDFLEITGKEPLDKLGICPSGELSLGETALNKQVVMFANREERAELLEGLIISNKDPTIPRFSQKIHLLWGEDDQIFKLQLAHNMKEQLGENATFQGIKKAGHLVHLERPCVYNRRLKQFLASLQGVEVQN